ncbi:MAG: hypothetical protein HYT64_00625 [Candidatus Yanofskybacteria bacterium]|nr:hypothetical protein [Candidatus Yanofskybacteria bacterium]
MERRLAVIFTALALVAMVQWSVLAQGPGTGFANSPHDFSGKAAGTNQRSGTAVTTGACTFCHTPHKAQATRLLWNHTLSSNTFNWSDASATVGGTPLGPISTSWTGPTRFCLSCHDGSVAIGDIAWFNRQAWNGGNVIDATKHSSGQYNIASPAGDLKGNHPVAHPYPYQRTANTYNGNTTGAGTYTPDFNVDPTALGIRLFNDSTGIVVAGAVAGSTGIECTSCHGVHNEVGLVFDEPLLRGTKDGNMTGSGASYICMKCHTR